MRDVRRRYGQQSKLESLRTWLVDHRRVVIPVGGSILLIILAQLLYPSDTVLPLSRLNGDMVGTSSEQAVASKLQAEYSNTTLTTKVRGKTSVSKLATTGIVTDNETILRGLSDYPWYLKIIPFSSLVKGALTDQPVVTKVDVAKFALYAPDRIAECTVAPKNAGVIVKDGEVQLDPAANGETCSKDSLARQLTASPLQKAGFTKTIQTTTVKPDRSDKDVQPLLAEAKIVAQRDLTLVVAGKTYQIDKPTLASWLAFPEDPETKQPKLDVNLEAVKSYLSTVQKDIYIAPGVTLVTTFDGIEKSRVQGASGQGINQDTTAASIREQVLEGDGTVTATLTALPPTVKYDRSYSKTPAGLQALVNDLVKDKGDFAISVRKLGDSGVHANGDKQYHPASTYKLFVAYSVLKRVDDGRMSLGQTTSGGQTLGQCLDNMIVNSDNACAEWFGMTIGWSTLTTEARALGASSTSLSRPFVSTTNDQALLLQKLESNQLGLTEQSRDRLLSAMKRQVYRKGIPAGVGVTVADKVGFLDGYLHDSAIVYAPSGVYVLVIYSNGSSWAALADAAKQIHAQLQ